MAVFPTSPDELTPDWLGPRLAPGRVLRAVAHDGIGTGQMAMSLRLTLDWESPADDLPATFVAKVPSADPTSRATGMATGAYAKEHLFYREIAPSTRARTARCVVNEFDVESQEFLLVLEDLAPARVGDQLKGCSVEQAEIAIDVAAALHASWWESPRLSELESWMGGAPTAERQAQMDMLWALGWAQFLERHEPKFSPQERDLAERFGAGLSAWMGGRTGPITVVHGDFRIDNMLFGADWMVPVDWQTTTLGEGVSDVAYFLGASLLPSDRRLHEERLVHRWCHGVAERGVVTPAWNDVWDRYRRYSFSGFLMAVVASFLTQRTDRGDEMFWVMASRHLAQARDLDAGALL